MGAEGQHLNAPFDVFPGMQCNTRPVALTAQTVGTGIYSQFAQELRDNKMNPALLKLLLEVFKSTGSRAKKLIIIGELKVTKHNFFMNSFFIQE